MPRSGCPVLCGLSVRDMAFVRTPLDTNHNNPKISEVICGRPGCGKLKLGSSGRVSCIWEPYLRSRLRPQISPQPFLTCPVKVGRRPHHAALSQFFSNCRIQRLVLWFYILRPSSSADAATQMMLALFVDQSPAFNARSVASVRSDVLVPSRYLQEPNDRELRSFL